MWRTLNDDRATSEIFLIEEKITFKWIFEIKVSEDLPSFRIFCNFVSFFGKDFDFKRSYELFHTSYAYILSM